MKDISQSANIVANVRYLLSVLLFAFASATLGACVEPLKFDSLTDDVEDLCASDESFKEAVQRCEQTGCYGVTSFRGTILSTPVALTDESVLDVEVKIVRFMDDGDEVLSIIDKLIIRTRNSLGEFVLEFRDLDALAANSEETTTISSVRGNGLERTRDGLLRATIRINNGTESGSVPAVAGVGHFRLIEASQNSVQGRFEIAYGTESDLITGCFAVFPGVVTHEVESL